MGEPGKIQDVYSLTPMQEGMLFHSLAEPDSQMYHELFAVRLKGILDVNAIEESLRLLVKRHDILRTVFLHQNIDKPRQVVLKERKTDFTYVDIRHFNTRLEKEQYIADFKSKDRSKTFDLSKHILFRMALLQIENDEYELYILHHHILMDGWSTGIFFNEFFSTYDDLKNGKQSRLSSVMPFKHYIKWLNNRNRDTSLAFWRSYLSDYCNEATIPRRSGFQEFGTSYKQNTIALTLNISKTQALNRLAADNELTLFNIMNSLWGILLAKYNQQNDIVFGTVVSGRPPEIDGIENMVGLFINTVPTRIKISGNITFVELFNETQRQSVNTQEHHYVALSDILNESELRRNLFNHLLAFENYPLDRGQISDIGQMNVQEISLYEQANYGLSIIIMPGNEITVNFVYNENEYEHTIITDVKNCFSCLIDQLLSHPEKKIKDIEMLPESELYEMLTRIHATETVVDTSLTICDLIEKQALTVPGKIAIIEGEKKLSYQELNSESSKIAQFLLAKNIGPGSIVGIMMVQSINMTVAMNGILKAGAAFLPLDPNYPEKRLDYMIKDSGIKIVLYDDDRYPEYSNVDMIHIHQIRLESVSNGSCDRSNQADNAYVIYTSGSTGQPKGAAITHKSAVNLLLYHIDCFKFDTNDICLELFSFSFDAFILSFFTPLCAGSTVILLKDEERGDPAKIAELIYKYKVTNFNCIPTLFNGITQHISKEQATSLRLIQLGGEKIDRNSITTIIQMNPSVEVAQEYGVTEASVASTVQRHQQDDPVLKIGKPIWNTYVYILDQFKKILPDGVPGELHIGGIGISSGYIDNEILTSEKFVANPFRANEKMYATGDIGRYCSDGAVEFLRRKDMQVKIRGYRIEINEIQTALKTHPYISDAVVIDKKDSSGNNCLFAYFIPKQDLEIKSIREFLSERIPGYMIPAYFIEMQKLPLTPNGKIDILGLKNRKDEIVRSSGFCEPENEIERILVNIWQEVLGVERVSTTDDFFELGGDSIKSIQIRSRLNRAGYHIELASIFSNPTITESAKRVTSNAVEIEVKEDIVSPIPVIPTQYRFINTSTCEEGQFVNAGLFLTNPPLLKSDFEQILLKVYDQHDALKMGIYSENGKYFQSVNTSTAEESFLNVENVNSDDPKQLELLVKKISATFDLTQGPLFSASFIPGSKNSGLLFVAHQTLIDTYSFKILFEDIGILLHQLINKTMLKLPPVSISYKKVLEGYKTYCESDSVKKDYAYWKSIINTEKTFQNLKIENKSIGKVIINFTDYIPAFLSGKINKTFNTNSDDIFLSINALAVKNVFPEKHIEFHMENTARGTVVDGVNTARTLGSFQTGFPVRLNSIPYDDLSKMIIGIKEVIHQVPREGLPYTAELMLTNAKNWYDNERPSPSFAFQFSRLDWVNSDHLSFSFVHNPLQNILLFNNKIEIAFDWKLDAEKITLGIYFLESIVDENTIAKLVEILKEKFSDICTFCSSRNEQSMSPSDFTYKGISLQEFDSIESFFK